METLNEVDSSGYTPEELMEWPRARLDELDRERLDAVSAHALAQFLERLEIDEQRRILRWFSAARAAAILAEMDEEEAADVLAEMRPHRASAILDGFEPDDAADIVAELSEADRNRLLGSLERKARKSIENLLAYDPDTAGGIMTTEVDTALEDMSIDEAIASIRRFADKHEDLHYVYVVDFERKLKGVISLRKLIQSRPDRKIGSVMKTELKGVCGPDMDKEAVGLLMAEHNLPDIAVVAEDGTLLGVITHDDVIDVMRDEATEDIQKLSGAGGDESIHDDISFSVKRRQPWLAMNLVTAFIAATVVSRFEDEIGTLPILAAIMPIIAGIGGNSGQQALAVTIRSMALNEMRLGDVNKVLLKQSLIGIINGLITGILAATMVMFFGGSWMLSAIVLAAMVLNLAVGCFTGAFVPVFLRKIKQDPIHSSIFLTFVTDTGGFFIFLTLGSIFLL